MTDGNVNEGKGRKLAYIPSMCIIASRLQCSRNNNSSWWCSLLLYGQC